MVLDLIDQRIAELDRLISENAHKARRSPRRHEASGVDV